MDAGSLAGLLEISRVQFTAKFAGMPKVIWIDDLVFSRNGTCGAK